MIYNVAIDIGSKQTKAAIAYVDLAKTPYAYPIKLVDGDFYPSLAYYNSADESWVFGPDVYSKNLKEKQFIVKIQDLLDLFKHANENVKNAPYYDEEQLFQKFYYPPLKLKDNMDELVANDFTFYGNCTPRELIISYLKDFIEKIKNSSTLEKVGYREGVDELSYTVTYPGNSELRYINELKSLVKEASGSNNVRAFNSTRAIGLCAIHNGIVGSAPFKNYLLVNVGAKETTVAKVSISKDGGMAVDDVQSHSAPSPVGGNAFDEAIQRIIFTKSCSRSVLGYESDSQVPIEFGNHTQQFNMMNLISQHKKLFNAKEYDEYFSQEGLKFMVMADCAVEVSVKREDLLSMCFNPSGAVTRGSGYIYNEFLDYIRKELSLPINQDLDGLILAGGGAEFYYLSTLISALLNKIKSEKFEFIEFSKSGNTLYAPAIGTALYAAGAYNCQIKTTYSYGTYYVEHRDYNQYRYSEIVSMGEKLSCEGDTRFLKAIRASQAQYVNKITNSYYKVADPFFQGQEIGMPGSKIRQSVEAKFGFSTIIDCDIMFSQSVPGTFEIQEGFVTDPEGRATPMVKPANPGTGITITICNKDGQALSDTILLN